MVKDTELAFTPAFELRELIAKKKLSPVEITDVYLRRIEALNPRLNAYLTVTAELARQQAQAAEKAVMRGGTLGELHGIPVSIKDNIVTKGIRTTQAAMAYKDWVPDSDDLVVERVRSAGAIILGKSNLSELGIVGTSGDNKLGEECHNPWDTSRVTGGSSAGAGVATAAGLNALAVGADGGGSIRTPSSFCGVFGLYPTQGRVAERVRTVNQWMPVKFGQPGPVTRCVRDAALLLQVLAGPHPEDPYCIREAPPDFSAGLGKGANGLRIAYSPDYGSIVVDPEVAKIVEQAVAVFAQLGAVVEPSPWKIDILELNRTSRNLSDVGTALRYQPLLEKWRDQMMPYSVARIERGMGVTGVEFARALGEMEVHRKAIADLFTKFDLLVSPVTTVPAFKSGQVPKVIAGKDVSALGFRSSYPFTFVFNMTGNPAASVPCGFSKDGLPIGLHVVGRRGEEATVLLACAALEEALPWAGRRPPIS